jgi:hypothetical protein
MIRYPKIAAANAKTIARTAPVVCSGPAGGALKVPLGDGTATVGVGVGLDPIGGAYVGVGGIQNPSPSGASASPASARTSRNCRMISAVTPQMTWSFQIQASVG